MTIINNASNLLSNPAGHLAMQRYNLVKSLSSNTMIFNLKRANAFTVNFQSKPGEGISGGEFGVYYPVGGKMSVPQISRAARKERIENTLKAVVVVEEKQKKYFPSLLRLVYTARKSRQSRVYLGIEITNIIGHVDGPRLTRSATTSRRYLKY
jgi:hypothetical protein